MSKSVSGRKVCIWSGCIKLQATYNPPDLLLGFLDSVFFEYHVKEDLQHGDVLLEWLQLVLQAGLKSLGTFLGTFLLVIMTS